MILDKMAETVGSLVDKITIINLKIYHMMEQLKRSDVDDSFKISVVNKIKILKIQRKDLEKELNQLFDDVVEGRKRLKVYRQFKMYNDPRYRMKK
ncbi:MAG: DUF4254 domain-containing protein [Elusimicrobiales bacterium]